MCPEALLPRQASQRQQLISECVGQQADNALAKVIPPWLIHAFVTGSLKIL